MKPPLPPLPPPSIFRGVPGFVMGFIPGIIIVGLVRVVQGMHGPSDLPSFFLSTDLSQGFMGTWINDEAMLMWGMLFGAIGFIWGTGGFIGTPLDESDGGGGGGSPQKPRIPSDPDNAPRPNPIQQLLGMAPSTMLLLGILILSFVFLLVVPNIYGPSTQVRAEEASTTEYGTMDFNLLGLVKFQNVDQQQMYIGFAVIIILLTLGAPVGMGIGLYAINGLVRDAQAGDPDPDSGQNFFLIRLAGFLNQWVLDIIQMTGSVFRSR